MFSFSCDELDLVGEEIVAQSPVYVKNPILTGEEGSLRGPIGRVRSDPITQDLQRGRKYLGGLESLLCHVQ